MREWTQEELAQRAGMTRTDLSKIENDKLSVGPARLERLADALEVSVLELSPEVEPDHRGFDLLSRLEGLEAGVDAILEGQKVGLVGQVELRTLIEGLRGTLDERLPEQPGRRRKAP